MLAAGAGAVRRIGGDGVVRVVAGTGHPGFSGDGGPATAARLSGYLAGVGALDDGGFLVFDGGNYRVRRVWPDGHITTVAGTGRPGAVGDGGPALAAQLPANPAALPPPPTAVSSSLTASARRCGACEQTGRSRRPRPASARRSSPVRRDGTVLWSDVTAKRVFSLSPDGRRTVFAGSGVPGHGGDGGPATKARLTPGALTVSADGSVLVADNSDESSSRIRRIDPARRIETVMGRSPRSVGIDDGSPEGLPAQFVGAGAGALAAAPDGGLYLTDVFADEIEGDHELVDLPSTVLYVPGSAAQRLAMAATIAASSPFPTASARRWRARRWRRRGGGRVVARAEQRLPAGVDRTIAPPAVPAGPYRIELRAVAADGEPTRAATRPTSARS